MFARLTVCFSIAIAIFLRADIAVGELADRPNILFIYADDHSAKTLSCYERSYRMANTPNIDALAASGVRFRAAYLGSWCMPSRASLLTGLHPHGIESMRMSGDYPGSTYDPQQCRFWPAVFRQNGYQTAQIGKWHTGTDAGWGRDWDFQIVWNRPDNPENAPNYYGTQVTDFNGHRRSVEGYSTDNYTQWACNYIHGEGRDADKPWYLWLCYGAIHGPTTPADRHQGKLSGHEEPLPSNIFGPRPNQPRYLDDQQAWIPDPKVGAVMKKREISHSQWLQQVHECMMAVDEGVGQILSALRESGQLENTLVVYSSDQGFANGEHGLRQKVAPYDAAYASPLIVSQPGRLPAGKYCGHSVNSPDLVATFFAQAGIGLPWKMHGRDFSQLLAEPESANWDHPCLFTNTGEDYGSEVTKALQRQPVAVQAGVPYFAAVCWGKLKYVRYLAGSESEELYDLEADPEELINLAHNPAFSNQLELMRQGLQSELNLADASFADSP